MGNPSLISYRQLCEWVNAPQRKSREKVLDWLHENRIEYTFDIKGNPITTVENITESDSEAVIFGQAA